MGLLVLCRHRMGLQHALGFGRVRRQKEISIDGWVIEWVDRLTLLERRVFSSRALASTPVVAAMRKVEGARTPYCLPVAVVVASLDVPVFVFVGQVGG